MEETPKRRIGVKRWIVLGLIIFGAYLQFGPLTPVQPNVFLPGEPLPYTIPIIDLPLTNTILALLVTDVLIIVMAFYIWRKTRSGNLVPTGFYNLLEACKRQFGIVIIDTPPAGLFPDSLMLGRYANEALYVCRHNSISRQKAKFFINQLVDAEVELLGVVWNKLKSNSASGQGYGYGYGHYNYAAQNKYYRPEKETSRKLKG